MRHAASIAAIGLVVVSCGTHVGGSRSELFAGHERTYLTLSLAESVTQLDLLQKLHEDDPKSAIEALQFELDARVLFLTEVLIDYGDHPEVQEKRSGIACHLQAIARYREQYGLQAKYPEVAEMASNALRHAPRCECSRSDARELSSQQHPTSSCS